MNNIVDNNKLTMVLTTKLCRSKIIIKSPELRELVKDKLPTRPRWHVSFDISANVSIANAIRRILIGELNINFLHFELFNCETDEAVTNDWLQNRLRMIPIVQMKDLMGKISVRNDTTEPRYILGY